MTEHPQSHPATPSEVAPALLGDVLVATGGTPVPPVGRTAGDWARLEQPVGGPATAQAWIQAPTDDWRGFPCRVLDLPDRRVILLGELYGTSDPVDDLRRVAEGRLDPGALDGHFGLLLLSDDGTVEMVTNRFGSVHLYSAADGRGGWFTGTFCPGVAAAAGHTSLDWEALPAFFEFGFFPADRTHFEAVRIVPPATRVRLAPGSPVAAASRTWTWRHEPRSDRGFGDTVAAFAEVFGEVMEDHLGRGDRVAVPISGGLDSRSTVAAITPADVATGRLWAYSYGYDDRSVETAIAGRVAAARGLPFTATTVGRYLLDELPLVTSVLEGFQDVTQARQAWIRRSLAGGADRVVAAHWGDVWLDSPSGAKLAAHPDPVELALATIRKRGADWLLDNLRVPGLEGRERLKASNRSFVETHLAGLEDLTDPAFRLKAFKTEAWSFRWTLASVRMHQAGAWPLLPFYDTRLADFMATVPEEWLRGRRLQIEYLKRFAPDLARVRWQDGDADLFAHPRPAPVRFARRGARWLARRLTGRTVIQRNWEVQLSGQDGRMGLEDLLLAPGRRLHDLVAPSRVGELLGRFRDDIHDPRTGYAVCMVVTVSSWLEQYG